MSKMVANWALNILSIRCMIVFQFRMLDREMVCPITLGMVSMHILRSHTPPFLLFL